MKRIKTIKIIGALIICCALGISSAHAAENIYLRLEGASMGLIEGDSTIVSLEREGNIVCVAANQEVSSPDGGRLNLGGFRFVKVIDKSSPLLYQALDTNEALEAEFRYFRPGQGGVEEHYYTIKLESGRISSIRSWFPSTFDPATATYPQMEEVTIVFGRITITYVDGGIEYTINTPVL